MRSVSAFQVNSLSISLRFNGHFPGEPGLAGTEAKDDASDGDNWSYKTCKAAVKSSPPTYHFLQAGCPSCHPTNSVRLRALDGNVFQINCVVIYQ